MGGRNGERDIGRGIKGGGREREGGGGGLPGNPRVDGSDN